MKSLFIAAVVAACLPAWAFAEGVCIVLKDAKVIGQDDAHTYLGKVANKYDADSIFNEYGIHGGPYEQDSVWNPYATFGNEYNEYAATNKYTGTPPMLVKNKTVIGFLSANKSMRGAISPLMLKALCAEEI